MLEKKVFRDELNFRDEIDTILRQLNNTDNYDTDKSFDSGQASTETKRELEAMVRIKAIQDGFEREKRYIRHQLKVFELEFNDMQQMVKNVIAEFLGNAEKQMKDMDKKLSEGSAYMNDIRDVMDNKIDSMEQNISEQFEINNISGNKMRLTIDELRNKVSGTSATLGDIQDKVKQIGLTIDDMNKRLFFKCGSWAKFGLSCYKLFDKTLSWDDAVRKCKAQDAYLVEVESSDEHTFLRNLITSNETNTEVLSNRDFFISRPGPWIGASDRFAEGKWVWNYSKRYLTYDSWDSAEPNGKKKENCVHMNEFAIYKWNDLSCDEKRPYICEKSVK